MKRSLRNAILERDRYECRKCHSKQSFDVHHIMQRSDGGTDEPENLITLCYGCHLEWHALKLHLLLPFENWLKVPPAHMMIKYFSDYMIKEGYIGNQKEAPHV